MEINIIRILFGITCATGCMSLKFVGISEIIMNGGAKDSIINFMNTIEKVVTDDTFLRTFVEESTFMEYNYMPSNCSQREKLKNQPAKNKSSTLKKCCPIGEGFSMFDDVQRATTCGSSNISFRPTIINAILYDNCIEDDESEINLPIQVGNPCNTSIVYSSQEDIFFVLQDGSLLIIDEYANDTYSVQNKYCIDVDTLSRLTYAIICITHVEEQLQRRQVVLVAILTLISIPCLCLVVYLHLAIKELRTLHGVLLSFMSFCLMLGYLLHSLVHIFNIESFNIGYAVQFFILSYFFWFFCLCGNIFLNIWLRLPLKKKKTRSCTYGGFAIYFSISVFGPLLFVVLTIHKGLPGMPSYFYQGITESIRGSQRYFIPPVSTMLIISFSVMIISFFGFQNIKKKQTTKILKSNIYKNINMEFDVEKYEEVKKDAKCISFLGVILIVTWLLEIVTFYSSGPQNFLILLEIINGLQGVFIMLIFLIIRRRRTLILRWWYDRGSHRIENMELSTINQEEATHADKTAPHTHS